MDNNTFHKELKKLPRKTRNRLRAVFSVGLKEAAQLLGGIRSDRSVTGETLLIIDHVLRSQPFNKGMAIPSLFPNKYHVSESFYRLPELDLSKFLTYLDCIVKDNFTKLASMIGEVRTLNSCLIKNDVEKSIDQVRKIQDCFGCSHFLLKKMGYINAVYLDVDSSLTMDFSELPGIDKNQLLSTMIGQIYQKRSNTLSIKRSLLNLKDKGPENKYTRDIVRTMFHPHAVSESDFSSMMQSALQFSLIDAISVASFNQNNFSLNKYSNLEKIILLFQSYAPGIDEIAKSMIDNDLNEDRFYKLSSAWFESPRIHSYRVLIDNYYDDNSSSYISVSPADIEEIELWVGEMDISELANAGNVTSHQFVNLHKMENSGRLTKTAVFNYRHL